MAQTTRRPTTKKNGTKPKRVNKKPEKEVSELGRVLRKLAEEYVASGGKLLSRRELEREIAERRGCN
jgi:hypothetical protein